MPRANTGTSTLDADIFATVKRSVDICTVIHAYTGQELRRSGNSYTGLCPFHADTSPSFLVQPARGTYHCFGCGAHGSVIDFAMQTYQLGPLDAARKLAEDFSIPIPDLRKLSPEQRAELRKQREQREQKRERKKALQAWRSQAYTDVCALRRMCWGSLCTAQDYYQHPEFIHVQHLCDYVLDILAFGEDAEIVDVLEAKLRGDLGMVGGFMP